MIINLRKCKKLNLDTFTWLSPIYLTHSVNCVLALKSMIINRLIIHTNTIHTSEWTINNSTDQISRKVITNPGCIAGHRPAQWLARNMAQQHWEVRRLVIIIVTPAHQVQDYPKVNSRFLQLYLQLMSEQQAVGLNCFYEAAWSLSLYWCIQ